ncbi:DUF3435 domain containing protein [Pyrenophora teres f. teres]|uniref:DUF3435 domain containing protein n=1 Tax=Pyrenophora teres f. teres TaxID=97479 RepID=A0A6S6VTQ5_9PLEO|nr:DUF3435 domain containing protein [Pyrenophora teres f. teres]
MAPPKKKSKVNLSHLRSLVHQEKAPTPLTADDIKNMMIPLSFKAHEYTMSLWADFSFVGLQQQEQGSWKRTSRIQQFEIAEDLIQFMWMCDEYQNPHPRARVQLAFSVVLMTLLGSRPGEFIESGAWKHSDEGLLYGDIDLVRYQNGTYTGYLLYLWLRNRKGHRNNKKHFPIMLLYEEAGMRSMCLVTYFLALALADGVFDGCESFKDIEVKELPLGSLLYTYRYKSEAKQRPILRSINPNGTVSDNEILTYNCFNNMLKGIGQRAGYEDRLSAYWFRRAYAKAVEKTATPAQRRLFMGHTNDDTVMYYISGIVGVDSQSMVYRREQKSELIDENTSMMLKRNLLAPMPPGSQLTDRLSRNADLTDGPVVTLPERTPSQEYALRRQSRKVAYRKQRGDFFDGKPLAPEYAVTAPHQTASDSESTGSTPLRYPSRYLKALWKFEPERERIANLMYSYSRNSVAPNNSTAISRREIPLSDILQPMTKLAHPKKERYVYQSAGPTEDNCCSVCGH